MEEKREKRDLITEKLSLPLNAVIADLPRDDREAVAKMMRAAKVMDIWAQACRQVFKQDADKVLQHVNSVSIFSQEGKKILAIYLDDSTFMAAIKTQQEFLWMALARLGEQIDEFKIYSSKLDMRKRHPYAKPEEPEESEKQPKIPLREEDEKRLREACESIEDEHVREALKNAVRVSFKS